jgi:hypothetical protein
MGTLNISGYTAAGLILLFAVTDAGLVTRICSLLWETPGYLTSSTLYRVCDVIAIVTGIGIIGISLTGSGNWALRWGDYLFLTIIGLDVALSITAMWLTNRAIDKTRKGH